eukprot:2953735-Prymnesium_polylepis.1
MDSRMGIQDASPDGIHDERWPETDPPLGATEGPGVDATASACSHQRDPAVSSTREQLLRSASMARRLLFALLLCRSTSAFQLEG